MKQTKVLFLLAFLLGITSLSFAYENTIQYTGEEIHDAVTQLDSTPIMKSMAYSESMEVGMTRMLPADKLGWYDIYHHGLQVTGLLVYDYYDVTGKRKKDDI